MPLPSGKPGSVGPMLAVLTVLLAAPSCSRPRFEGPQIQQPPEGFLYDANSYGGRKVFREREVLWEGGWWRMDSLNDLHASIHLTAFRGPSSRSDVQAVHDDHVERYSRPPYNEYGGVEQLMIDGRPAWGWSETQFRGSDGSVAAQQFRAVVSYDTVTYAIEFFSDIRDFMDVEEQKATVATFAVGTTEVDWLLVAIALVAAVVGASRLKSYGKKLATPTPIPEIRPGPAPRGPPSSSESAE